MVKRLLVLTIIFLCCSAMTLIYFSGNTLSNTKIKTSPEVVPKPSPKPKPIPKDFFEWPVKGNIDLAGNFGELRINHFHSGVDIRTEEGKEGIPIYAAGDGYVGRINISTKGYGKALYIVHPNGYTSVYGHLSSFVPAISAFLEKKQYELKTFEIEIQPEVNLLKVKKGDLIAYSGNTGGSAGPHLHFEIRDSETDDAMNPLLFGLKLNDNVKPQINSITVYRLDNTNRLQTGTYRFSQFSKTGNTISNPELSLHPGTYAFGASWVDYLRAGGFRMGIPYAKLYINGKLVFTQSIERIPFADGRLMNCHIDHPVLEEKDLIIVKLFIDDGNTLDIYPLNFALFKKKTDTIPRKRLFRNRGRILIEGQKQYDIKLLITDFSGQRDSVKFTITGKKEADPNTPPERIFLKENLGEQTQLFYPDKLNQIEFTNQVASLKVEVPKGVLYDTVLFRLSTSGKQINGNGVWDIMSSSIPINDSFSLAFKPSNPIANPEKYVILRLTKAGAKRPEGGKWQDGFIKTKAKMLGQFYYDVDETAPIVSGLKVTGRKFSGKIKDELSGIKEITTTVDDQWILTDYEPKLDFIFGNIPDLITSGKHEFKITVKDYCGNIKIYSQTITL
ncbi:MAG: M23 family metallopeptidase [Bacteroidia bacterium]